MKLISLELLGFKSFLNRTTFRFNEGVTCIVGPNGCGKSNIVDAISWVLGERGTKSLRVKEMGDVIFHGSNSKKQVNVAEVALGLVSEEKEHTIKRRIYRDGTNEYYLNADIVRLKDIQDFLLGTGIGLHSYAIIEQGNIEYFTQMKPHERRLVVEETSGITRFEEKKRDAFARMEEVKVNLDRVEDVQREVAKAFEKAEEESGRLKVYNDLKARLREIDIAILVDGHGKLVKREGRLHERLDVLAREMETALARKGSVQDKVAAKDEEITVVDKVARDLELDIKGKEKDMESRLLELNYLGGEKKRLEAAGRDLRKEIDDLVVRIDTGKTEIERLLASTGQEQVSLKEIEEQAGALEARRDELRRMRERVEREAEEERNRLFGVMTRLTEIRNSILERERMAREREARRQRRIEEEKILAERLAGLDAKSSVLRERLEKEKEDLVRVENEEAGLVTQHEALNTEINGLRNEVEGLKGVKRGKEEVFRQMKSYTEVRKGEPLPFKQLINILKPSKDNEQMTEKFFPKEMEYHVLSGSEPRDLAAVATKHGANFVFFPPKGMFELQEGEADVRHNRVADLEEAFRRIANGEEGLFLADHTLVDSRGFVRKSLDTSALSIRQFREKMRLETEIAGLGEQLKTKAARLEELQLSLRELDRSRQTVREKKKTRESTISAIEREAIDIQAQIRTARERLNEEGQSHEPRPEEDDEAFFARATETRTACEEEKGRGEEKLADLKEKLQEAKEEHTETDGEFHKASIAVERLRNQLKKNEEEMARRKAAADSFERERQIKQEKEAESAGTLVTVSEKATRLEEGYGLLQEECKKAVARYEEMKAKLGDLHVEKAKDQEELKAFDLEIEKTRQKKEGVEKEKLILGEKKEAIRERLRNDYGVEGLEEVSIDQAPDEAARERLLHELAAVGEVNFRAEKERAELKERFEFLGTQKEDLTQAIDSLKKTIAKIDSVSRDLFLETFEKVNDAFRRFTGTLFKGGHGSLMLNQETSGIDLYVQPPGKKVIRMELLSGGEKALISLAFLLSLMDTKASPFTLMDEIDAPLDDANLLSLLEIIKTISRKTQTLIITHNRLTMEAAGTIYGITMEEPGISKTISIQL
jgi:chromosome segregation protein